MRIANSDIRRIAGGLRCRSGGRETFRSNLTANVLSAAWQIITLLDPFRKLPQGEQCCRE